MTRATLTADLQIGNALTNLAIARATRLDEETAIVYARQLEDLPPALIERACVRLANAAPELFGSPMPSVGEIRATVRALERDDEWAQRARAEAALPAPDDTNPWTWVRCRNCGDEGWVGHTCPGGASRTCGRGSKGSFVTDERTKRTHYWGACQRPHPFVVRCVCHYYQETA
jgi:hypothetical protein